MRQEIAISALQHYAYCPRQCALIHLEQAWSENQFTAEGRVLHERVDRGAPETRKGVRYERAVDVRSSRLMLVGKLDLLEINQQSKAVMPVEYKRGRPKVLDWDRIQLCAQVLCLEEMMHQAIPKGALWYWQSRRREEVEIDAALRASTTTTINKVHELLQRTSLPGIEVPKTRCRGCSLIDNCQPDLLRQDHTKSYCQRMFADEKTAK